MGTQIKVEKDKKGKFEVVYSYELDEQGLLKRKNQLERSIKAYDYQIKGLTETTEILKAEIDSINKILGE